MGQALYRTHRPKKLSEVVGQEHITEALKHALKKGTISHAYLFTGPRGTGKTSIARILAHEINKLSYEDGATHLDIIEIDAASNRRIDEIRDLRDKVHIAPTSAEYKIYIIDEAHMLTREAFNALLKTLEEPPAHVIFILATTEVHKLPETIISRTQRFAFKPVDQDKVIAHLRMIAKHEKIDIDDDALRLIAAHGEGSFRDSISLLDQIRNQGQKVTLTAVQATLGIAPAAAIADMVAAVSAHDVVRVAETLQTMQTQGYEPMQVAKQLGQTLRQSLVSGTPALEHEVLLQLLGQLVSVPASPDPRTSLEITLLDVALKHGSGVSSENHTAKQPEASPPKAAPAAVHTKPVSVTAEHPSSFKKPATNASTPTSVKATSKHEDISDGDTDAPVSTATLDMNVWAQVLAAIKQKYSTLYSVVRSAHPIFEPGKITLEFGYTFHQKRLNEKKNKQVVAEILQQLTGEAIQILCIVNEQQDPNTLPPIPAVLPPADEQVHTVTPKQAPAAQPAEPAPANPAIAAISNIFGAAEVLES